MDFQSAMETFAEAWVAANAGHQVSIDKTTELPARRTQQMSQAFALTRAANAAAAVAAANAVKSPTANLLDVNIKKEHSLSPTNGNTNSQISTHATSGSTGVGGALGCIEDASSQRRRSSLQGVQDKLTQLQQLHQNQQQQQQHHNQQHQHQQQQLQHQQQLQPLPQQQQQQLQQQTLHQQQAQQLNDDIRSPHYGSRRRSADLTSPATRVSDHNDRNLTTALLSSQNRSLASTPIKSNERDERNSNVGSISCLPSSVLTQQQLPAEKLLTAAAVAAASLDTRRDFDMSKVNSKSLPLHCVVESVHSLQASLAVDTRNPWKRRPNVETDSYVIIAAATPWCEIVQTALQRLGYSLEAANTARGSLLIKNWKPIPLEQISENPVVPVSDIIGELTSVITLRIVILRTKPSPFGEIKDKLLKLLVLQAHGVLRSTGCPLDEATLSQICRSSYQNPYATTAADISEELRRKFDQWWSTQLSPQAAMTPKMLPFMPGTATVPNDIDFPSVGLAAAAAAAQAGLHTASTTGNATNPTLSGINLTPSISASRESLLMADAAAHHGAAAAAAAAAAAVAANASTHHGNMLVHPVMHAPLHHHHHPHHPHVHSPYPNQKTRMRTSFDPEMELPKLQKWFQENPHPSRQQIQAYVVQLNALESRRGRKPLDVNNVVYWFKNARAAQKRAEMRGSLSAISALGHAAMNGYLSQHSQLGQGSTGGSSSGGSQQMSNMSLTHDYLKSPMSLKSEDIDTLSQRSDDLDDDQSPGSPQLPLSLTIHERNRSSPIEDAINHVPKSRRNSLTNIDDDEADKSALNGATPQTARTHSRAQSFNDDDNNDAVKLDKDAVHHTKSHDSENANVSLKVECHTTAQPNDTETNNNDNALTNNTSAATNNSNILNNNSNNNDNSNTNTEQLTTTSTSNTITTTTTTPTSNDIQSPKIMASPKEEDDELDMDDDIDEDNENDTNQLDDYRSSSPDLTNPLGQRKDLAFPMVPNSMFSQSFMYMSHYMPAFGQAAAAASAHPHAHHAAAAAAAAGMQTNHLIGAGGLNLSNLSNLSNEERRKRNRTFIDPVTEVPKLEQWFAMNTHPSHNLILKYTEDLNTMPYRQKFPRLESKNVQFWFKNRRAKCKRLKMSLYDSNQCSQLSGLNSFVHKYEERD